MSPTPYYSDGNVTLYHGDMRDLVHDLGQFDACITDPPYGDTTLQWDYWPKEWPLTVAHATNSMWCFGSMRMFFSQLPDFVQAGWKMSQDLVWEKHNGSGFATDRFRRVHEHAVHWYRGKWGSMHHQVPRVPSTEDNRRSTKRKGPAGQAPHMGAIGAGGYTATDRMARSVIREPSCNGKAIHPTEKPAGVLAPLLKYSVPAGGIVLDPFAGSGSTLLTARQLGRRAVGIEADEAYCEAAANRLSIPDLFTAPVALGADTTGGHQ